VVTFDEDVPVTLILARKVKSASVAEFEKWLHAIAASAMKFDGHLGVNVIRPPAGSFEYTTIFRFRTPRELAAWMGSDVRARLLAEAESFWDGEARMRELHGIEAWFTVPDAAAMKAPPPRFKMAIVSFLAVFPLLQVIPRVAAPIVEPLPQVGRVFVVSATMIVSMTYVVMPALTRLLSRWLYGPAR
jgi:uncharacterized protein